MEYNEGLVLGLLVILFVLLLFYLGKKIKKRLVRKVTGNYVDGIRCLVRGDRKQAILHLTKVARNDTENIDAFLLLGDLLREENKAHEAIKVHKSLLNRVQLKKDDMLRIYRSLALDYLASSNWDKALKILDKAFSIRKEIWIYSLLQRVHEARGEFEKAYKYLEKVNKVSGKKDLKKLALYKVEHGKKSMQEGKYHDARILFKEAIKMDAQCLPAYLYLGDAYSLDSRQEEAIEWWNKLAKTFPNHSHLVFKKLETAYFKNGEFNQIIRFYEELLDKSPGNDKIILALVRIYDKMGEQDRAIEVIEAAGTELDIKMKMRLAKLYAASGKSDKEITDWFSASAGDLLHEEGVFECEACGFKSTEPLWHCPQCKSWQSFGMM